MNLLNKAASAALATAVTVLSGCAVYPVGPVGVEGSVYSNEPIYYRNAPPLYYEPAPYYGAPPVYYGPGPIIIDRNRGNWDRDRRGDRDRFDRDHRGGDRGPGGRPPPPQGPPMAQPAPRPRPPEGRPPAPEGARPQSPRIPGDVDRGLRRND